jgi:hypothetical protein
MLGRSLVTIMPLNPSQRMLHFSILAIFFLNFYALVIERQDLNAQTKFLFADSRCTSSQQAAIVQANKDALELANAAFDTRSDELEPEPTKWEHKYIDFNTQAAVDYFGLPKLNLGRRRRIYDTFYRATDVYSGWGWDD